jgi:hypothetical protein
MTIIFCHDIFYFKRKHEIFRLLFLSAPRVTTRRTSTACSWWGWRVLACGSRLFPVCNSLDMALSALPRASLLTNDATKLEKEKEWTFIYLLSYSLIQTAGRGALHCDVSLVVLQFMVTRKWSTAAAICLSLEIMGEHKNTPWFQAVIKSKLTGIFL